MTPTIQKQYLACTAKGVAVAAFDKPMLARAYCAGRPWLVAVEETLSRKPLAERHEAGAVAKLGAR